MTGKGAVRTNDGIIGSGNGISGDRNRGACIGEFEAFSERVGWREQKDQRIVSFRPPEQGQRGERTDVQTSILGQVDRPVGVRDVLGFLVERPGDVVSFPSLPYGRGIWRKDLGDPNIPGSEFHRSGEDGRSGKEESGESGREFHG